MNRDQFEAKRRQCSLCNPADRLTAEDLVSVTGPEESSLRASEEVPPDQHPSCPAMEVAGGMQESCSNKS